MPHRLTLNSTRGVSTFDFEVEYEGRNGWTWLRLMRLEDNPPLVSSPAIQNYDPAIHNGGSHCMSRPWRARGINMDGVRRYRLVNAFGTPG